MVNYEINSTHVERGIDKLLTRYQQPRNEALLASRLRMWQRIENVAWEAAFVVLSIENGFGVILDRIGKIVGRGRKNLSDADYKIGLYTKIRINRSNGNPQDFDEVASLAGVEIHQFTRPDACFTIELLNAPTSLGVFAILCEDFATMVGLGIGFDLVYGGSFDQDNALLWGWDGASYDASDGLAHGLSWDVDGDGGYASDVVRLT